MSASETKQTNQRKDKDKVLFSDSYKAPNSFNLVIQQKKQSHQISGPTLNECQTKNSSSIECKHQSTFFKQHIEQQTWIFNICE